MKKITKTVIAAAASLLLIPTAAINTCAADSVTDPNNKTHETTDTLVSVGSISKVFVTAAAMQLADQGKIDIDSPVVDYLPDFRLADPRYKDITVRMLMNHRSGLMGSYNHDSIFFGYRSTLPHDDFLKNISHERLKAAPPVNMALTATTVSICLSL